MKNATLEIKKYLFYDKYTGSEQVIILFWAVKSYKMNIQNRFRKYVDISLKTHSLLLYFVSNTY